MKRSTGAITVRLPKDLKNEVEKLCEDSSIGTSDLVREALKHYLSLAKFRKLRGELLPIAEKQKIYTDEDVFEIVS
jgi:metal-responsive CopG/Arc/MetJ family transcriptional regulator